MNRASADSPSASRVSLAQLYRATLKRQDSAFNVYLIRPLAAVVVYGLKDTRVAPNQLTLFSALVAFAAAIVFVAVPWPLGLGLGVVVFEVSYVLDKADGMLARARGVQSSSGPLLDALMDEIKAFVTLAAVATGAWQHTGRVGLLLVGLAGLVCLGSSSAMASFMQRPEVLAAVAAGAAPPVDESEPPPPVASVAPLSRRAVRWGDVAGRLLLHYPSYIWLAVPFADARVYLYPYVAINALYGARSLGALVLGYGGWAPPPSAEAASSLRRAVELVEQEGDDVGG